MSNRYLAYARFFERNDHDTPVPANAPDMEPVSMVATYNKNQHPEISITLPYYWEVPALGTAAPRNQYKWTDYIKKGRHVTTWVHDTYHNYYIPFGTFIVEDFTDQLSQEGVILVEGTGISKELEYKKLWEPIGIYDYAETTVKAGNGIAAPRSTIVSEDAVQGQDYVEVAFGNDIHETDHIRIHLDNGNWFNTTCSKRDGNNISLAHRLPGPVTNGRGLEFLKREIIVDDVRIFYEGDIVFLERDTPDGIRTEDAYTVEARDSNKAAIYTSEGIIASSAAGKKVKRGNWATATANDVADTLFDHGGTWNLVMQSGRQSKTALGTKGASALDVLRNIADTHGEYFYFDTVSFSPKIGPKRDLVWRYTASDRTSITIEDPLNDVRYNQIRLDNNYGIMTDIQPAGTSKIVNRIFLKGAGAGDDRISIADASDQTIIDIATDYGVFIEGSTRTAFVPWNMRHENSINQYGSVEENLKIDLLPASNSPADRNNAADQILRAGANYLRRHSQPYDQHNVTALLSRTINPGDILAVRTDNYVTGSIVSNWQVLTVSRRYDNGVFTQEFSFDEDLSANAMPEQTSEEEVAATIVNFNRIQDRFSAPAVRGNEGEGLNFAASGGGGISYVGGEGIAIAGTTVNVDLHPTESGLRFIDDQLSLAIPDPLSASSISAASATGHSHEVTSVTDGNTTPGEILQTDSNGSVTVRKLQATNEINTPRIYDAGAVQVQAENDTLSLLGDHLYVNLNGTGLATMFGNMMFSNTSPFIGAGGTLSISPNNGLNINPLNGDTTFQWTHSTQIHSSNYISQTQGWSLSHGTTGGHLDIRSLFADEFRVKAFIAELSMALAGGMRITKSRGVVSDPFIFPTSSGQVRTVTFHDIPEWGAFPIFDQRKDDICSMTYVELGASAVGVTVWGVIDADSYTNLGDGRQQWDITWTYTGSGNPIAGKTIPAGALILDYGTQGHSAYIDMSVLDAAGAPYIRTINVDQFGADNRPSVSSVTFQAGNLNSLPNIGDEDGFFGGRSRDHHHIAFSNARAEIHGPALYLYDTMNNDSLQLRLYAIEVDTNTTLSVAPQTDKSAENVYRSVSANTYESHVDEDPKVGQPDSRWLANETGDGAKLTMILEPISGTPVEASVNCYVGAIGVPVKGDQIELWVSIQDSSNVPITEAVKIADFETGWKEIHFKTFRAGASWTNAQLRVVWNYYSAIDSPSIALDPAGPYMAIGNPLPTGMRSGGAGIYLGINDLQPGQSLYGARIGEANGARLEYNNTGSGSSYLGLYSGDNERTITLWQNGDAVIEGVLSLGASGGIWQGSTGDFSSPYTGLKLWRDSNQRGRLTTYSAGAEQIDLDTNGKLKAGAGAVTLDATGIMIQSSSNATTWSTTNALRFSGGSEIAGLASGGIRVVSNNRDNYVFVTDQLAYLKRRESGIELDAGSNTRIKVDTSVNPFAGMFITSNNGALFTAEPVGTTDWQTINIMPSNHVALEFAHKNVTHGMTVDTNMGNNQWGRIEEQSNSIGGVRISGATETDIGMQLMSYVTNPVTAHGQFDKAPISLHAFKRNGSGITAFADNENLFRVANGWNNKFFIKGNGDVYAGSHVHAFDIHNDVMLLRTLERHLGGTDHSQEGDTGYNDQDLIDLDLITADGLVNHGAWKRLLSGAIWQLYQLIQNKG